MHDIYLGDIRLPVAPAKINMSIDGRNKTITLMNENEVNLLKNVGLKDIDFEVLLPRVLYPFAVYPLVREMDGKEKMKFIDGIIIAKQIEDLFASKQPFKLKIIRYMPSTETFQSTSFDVSIESLSITEDASEGPDLFVSIKMKEYKPFVTKTDNAVEKTRETSNSPAPKDSPKTYTVVKGDTLCGISKKFYGTENNYNEIATANNIPNPNFIKIGQVLKIPVL